MKDVFISYASSDRDRVAPIVAALRQAGVDVWFDANDISMFSADITADIEGGIRETAFTLAFISAQYQQRQACKWELLRTIQVGQFNDLKLVVIDAEADRWAFVKNLHYFDLATREPGGLVQEVITAVRNVRRRTTRPDLRRDHAGFVTNAFTGRFDERIDLIAKLGTHLGDPHSDSQLLRIVQITGLGGQGKTMLARQYATDRALAYAEPLLLDAGGDRAREDDPTAPMDRLLGSILGWLEGIGAKELPERNDPQAWPKVKAAVRARQSVEQPYLWIVDDLPSGLSAGDVDNLTCPAPGHTLVTTRTGYYDDIITEQQSVRLGPMSRDDAVYLLAGGAKELMSAHGDTLAQIAEEVGFHSLAMGVLAPRFRSQNPQLMLTRLRGSVREEFEELQAAAALVGQLPSGHEASIVATLQDSVEAVTQPAARQILTLASMWPSGEPMETQMLAAVIPGREHDGIDELVRANLATMLGYDSLRVHAILAKVVAWLALDDPEHHASEGLRLAAAGWLAQRVDDKQEDAWDQAEAGTLTWHLLEPIADSLGPADAMRAFRGLMAMARLPMRYKPTGLHGPELAAHLREALGWARRAEELVQGDGREAVLSRGRALAMQGLLSLDLASRDDVNALNTTLEALDLLDESWTMRSPLLTAPGDLDERTKAQFNFGRAYLKLGQVRAQRREFEQAQQALDASMRWYGSTAEDRQVLVAGTKGDDRPAKLRDLASCYRGQAFVCMQTAALIAGPTGPRRALLDAGWSCLLPAREYLREASQAKPGKAVLADMAKDMQVAASLAMLGDVFDLIDANVSPGDRRQRLAEAWRDRPRQVMPWDVTGPLERVEAGTALARLDAHTPGAGDEHMHGFLALLPAELCS